LCVKQLKIGASGVCVIATNAFEKHVLSILDVLVQLATILSLNIA
jgi:hypothetical protein